MNGPMMRADFSIMVGSHFSSYTRWDILVNGLGPQQYLPPTHPVKRKSATLGSYLQITALGHLNSTLFIFQCTRSVIFCIFKQYYNRSLHLNIQMFLWVLFFLSSCEKVFLSLLPNAFLECDKKDHGPQ